MGLEVATYIDGLTVTWPASGDQRKQGDDHLRLLKSVLKSTFPNADRAFRFPRTVNKTADYSVLATDDNSVIFVDTSAGNKTITLPALPSTAFRVVIAKTTGDANTVTISGTVNGGSLTALSSYWQNVEIIGYPGVGYFALRPVPPDLIKTGDIAANAVTLAKLVNASAQGKLLGRKTAAAGNWEEVTPSEILNTIASVAQGDILLRGAANWDRLELGAAGEVLTSDGTDLVYGFPKLKRTHLREQQNNGVASSTALSGNNIWHKRLLNTEVLDEIGTSISSGVFTLGVGTYRVHGTSTFRAIGANYNQKLRLRDTTNNADLAVGQNITVGSNAAITGAIPSLDGHFTIASGTPNIELQHWVAGTTSGQSFGDAVSSGSVEVYAELIIEQVA